MLQDPKTLLSSSPFCFKEVSRPGIYPWWVGEQVPGADSWGRVPTVGQGQQGSQVQLTHGQAALPSEAAQANKALFSCSEDRSIQSIRAAILVLFGAYVVVRPKREVLVPWGCAKWGQPASEALDLAALWAWNLKGLANSEEHKVSAFQGQLESWSQRIRT